MIDPDRIDESEIDKLIDELSDLVIKRGMETPAVLFLELNKPMGFIASQATIVSAPVLAPLFGIDKVGQFSKLISSRDSIEKLIVSIERKANSN